MIKEKALTSDILIATSTETVLLEMLLSTQNYRLEFRDTGEATLAYLREATPALIMLDAKLPDVSGTALCSRIKRVSRLKPVPLMLLVSAKNTQGVTDASLCGCEELITKPLAGQDIRARVAGLLGKQTLSDHPLSWRQAS